MIRALESKNELAKGMPRRVPTVALTGNKQPTHPPRGGACRPLKNCFDCQASDSRCGLVRDNAGASVASARLARAGLREKRASAS